jgi:uncharacterized membrane-anchored protein
MPSLHRLPLRAVAVALLAAAAFAAAPASGQEADVEWTAGPATVELGRRLAQIELAEGHLFADAAETRRLMERMGNPPSDREVGMIVPAADDRSWLLVFEHFDVGYVRDDDKDEIDAAALLKGIREGTEAANEFRAEKGFAPLHVTGWLTEPHYDDASHHLVWAMEAEEEGSPDRVANYNVRLLGRKGYMSVTLATDPQALATDRSEIQQVLAGFSYKDGSRYGDFVAGDKVAQYGLTALVAGGAGAAAMKLGLFGKLGKFLAKGWKLVAAGLVALGAAAKRLFGRRTAAGSDLGTAG